MLPHRVPRESDPLGHLVIDLRNALSEALSSLGAEVPPESLPVSRPKRVEMGDLGCPVGFKAARDLRRSPAEVAEEVCSRLELPPGASSAAPSGGYVNFRIDMGEVGRAIIEAARAERLGRGLPSGLRVVVEHTSVNPVHPLHVGSGRNAFLGDSFARMLRWLGHDVETHYLVNDSGLQPAYLAYGWSKVRGRLRPRGKPDHWFGVVYAAANIAMELRRPDLSDERRKELEEALSDLRRRAGELADEVFLAVSSDPDPEGGVADLLRRYQSGDPDAKSIFRECCEAVMEGFVETLQRVGVVHDP